MQAGDVADGTDRSDGQTSLGQQSSPIWLPDASAARSDEVLAAALREPVGSSSVLAPEEADDVREMQEMEDELKRGSSAGSDGALSFAQLVDVGIEGQSNKQVAPLSSMLRLLKRLVVDLRGRCALAGLDADYLDLEVDVADNMDRSDRRNRIREEAKLEFVRQKKVALRIEINAAMAASCVPDVRAFDAEFESTEEGTECDAEASVPLSEIPVTLTAPTTPGTPKATSAAGSPAAGTPKLGSPTVGTRKLGGDDAKSGGGKFGKLRGVLKGTLTAMTTVAALVTSGLRAGSAPQGSNMRGAGRGAAASKSAAVLPRLCRSQGKGITHNTTTA